MDRDETVLAELGPADAQNPAGEIDIVTIEAQRLAGA